MARSLDQIGDWWSLLIIRDALDGARRFTEFQKRLGLAKNILSARLSKLVSHGILRLEPASDGSVYQEYVLTEKGESLRIVLLAFAPTGPGLPLRPGRAAHAARGEAGRHAGGPT
ncbi:winged helix-turn-helix transcriptional regulator [Streptomyces sp. NPDC093261]|uniref:winged helix-turn-helix transcriptional regulator n=1 Tax=Streptomyces sp. NPDC093261 TaxID=3366037 RepID=UPI0037FC3B2C